MENFFMDTVVPSIIFITLLAMLAALVICIPLGIRHNIQKREKFSVLYQELKIPIDKDAWEKLSNDEQFILISRSINNSSTKLD